MNYKTKIYLVKIGTITAMVLVTCVIFMSVPILGIICVMSTTLSSAFILMG
jgi:hypothetical protein